MCVCLCVFVCVCVLRVSLSFTILATFLSPCSFSAVNSSVLLIPLLLSLILPFGHLDLCLLVQRVSFFFFLSFRIMTPVDVSFAGGGAERAVGLMFSGSACVGTSVTPKGRDEALWVKSYEFSFAADLCLR